MTKLETAAWYMLDNEMSLAFFLAFDCRMSIPNKFSSYETAAVWLGL